MAHKIEVVTRKYFNIWEGFFLKRPILYPIVMTITQNAEFVYEIISIIFTDNKRHGIQNFTP